MVVPPHQYLKPVGSLLKVPLDKSNIINNCSVTSSIIKTVEKSQPTLGPLDNIETSKMQQWIEYSIVYAANIDCSQDSHTILKELDDTLSITTYLIASRPTIADVLLYHVLVNILASLGNSDKESYMNVCRWFDNIQQNKLFRQSNKLVNFTINYLSRIANIKVD
ncbi:unnamed protein product [Acanthoscelides obtectus]|uniref:GST C-terminal domain-containing protein n=1 Tax=Acanthoscelides obtectus TaxID=200917 RepID=A0A9P0PHP2_ACAOB|nr:unnamed protein product [Acanthoscelides obtectus]CAK1650571.1 Eukaryotic translation elongation factor 1 epsilon-1 [Acanthoscelides obtectus]